MSKEELIDVLGMDSSVKRLYDSIEGLKDSSIDNLMQQSRLSEQEAGLVDILYGLGDDYNLQFLKNEARRVMLLSKSRDGWFIEKLTDILKKIGGSEGEEEGLIGQVDSRIRDAFSG